ncbi:hypothetical protein DICSQDRAFT_157117 [Dichomitus squalens LYAD-421 SS1]|uniref:Zn(2)-C6 fungal-type domain-containing protein n=1 Tax=Dichomitus squalens (strain LYAD-421) TaxID=732165 RepID=R7SSE5_DICSQ|nr:uncharacterized protein DICSQDRAFT_157117 [Dichomitus squalens LYAD-421 SS1]EJF57907.1 hypothetical protein DICSQDRAFT_157117 [Dichomitus squalens LYAD-421 SS1]
MSAEAPYFLVPAGSGSPVLASASPSGRAESSSSSPTVSPDSTGKKGKVQLSADQALTAEGRPRARVCLACVQCRKRKRRCDGVKPECNNCLKRSYPAAGPCSYDAAPRRRGRDRAPGSRLAAAFELKKTRTTRSRFEGEGKGPRKEKRAVNAQPARDATQETSTVSARTPVALLVQDTSRPPAVHRGQSASTQVITGRMEEEELDKSQGYTSVWTPPGVRFIRETWWDALLTHHSGVPAGSVITADIRDSAMQAIFADLRSLFKTSLHWLSFVNIPRFFASLRHPIHRQAVQPSLIYGALAMSTFFQSSELEMGAKGREKALQLLDRAHAMFDASLTAGWIDLGLVQAAWLFAMFELQGHPANTAARGRSAFDMLDSLIRSLSLTILDVMDPRTSVFLPGQVPVVVSTSDLPNSFTAPPATFEHGIPTSTPRALHEVTSDYSPLPPQTPMANEAQRGCGCSSYSLGTTWPISATLTPAWTCMPMWPESAGEGEMQKEECRRLVWSAITLAITYSSHAAAGTDQAPKHLWIQDAANYALLFPGESLVPPGTTALPFSKESVWALYMRVQFLWHSAMRQRGDPSLSSSDRAAYAMSAWLELDHVEECIGRHSCTPGSGFKTQLLEMLFNTRMVVSHEFRKYIPEAKIASGLYFYREKAERWMNHALGSAQHVMQSMKDCAPSSNNYTRRCFMMYWYMSQMTRALSLWEADPTLLVALTVAKAFAPCVEFMMMIWPSPSQRIEYQELRNWLVRSCMSAGVALPDRAIPIVLPTRFDNPS